VRIVDYRSFKTADGHETNLLAFIYERVFAPLASPVNASLMFAVCTVLFWLGVLAILYRRRIFIRV
jgi:predicted acyltransferase